MFPEFTPHTEFPRSSHPGTVAFVGVDGVARMEPAEQLPDWLKFAPAPDGRIVPVVRVVRVASSAGYVLRSYGPDGQLLWVTMPVSTAPRDIAMNRPTARGEMTTAGGWF